MRARKTNLKCRQIIIEVRVLKFAIRFLKIPPSQFLFSFFICSFISCIHAAAKHHHQHRRRMLSHVRQRHLRPQHMQCVHGFFCFCILFAAAAAAAAAIVCGWGTYEYRGRDLSGEWERQWETRSAREWTWMPQCWLPCARIKLSLRRLVYFTFCSSFKYRFRYGVQ